MFLMVSMIETKLPPPNIMIWVLEPKWKEQPSLSVLGQCKINEQCSKLLGCGDLGTSKAIWDLALYKAVKMILGGDCII